MVRDGALTFEFDLCFFHVPMNSMGPLILWLACGYLYTILTTILFTIRSFPLYDLVPNDLVYDSDLPGLDIRIGTVRMRRTKQPRGMWSRFWQLISFLYVGYLMTLPGVGHGKGLADGV